MRQKQLFLPTLREAPAEAEAVSHALLLRAGYIRQQAAGIYSYLPLGWRVLRKIEAIVREELERAGAQELLMPAMQPAELWRQSGRYDKYGPELIRLGDRHGREFALGPTHEEVITSLIGSEISSYRKLPLTMFQLQTKFRDERRPRFGLLRCREFLMMDAYSFHTNGDSLEQTYSAIKHAYRKIFERCGLNFRAVEADAGTIGGDGGSHEYMALASIGEDTIVSCIDCDYAANLEKAEAAFGGGTTGQDGLAGAGGNKAEDCERLHTPELRSIEELVRSLGAGAERFIKTLIYNADGQPVVVLVRGDREVNEAKVLNHLQADSLELADEAMVAEVTGAPAGFAGPVGLKIDTKLLIDREVASMEHAVTGANEKDYHFAKVRPGIHFTLDIVGDFRNVSPGDRCPRCGEGELSFHEGIEVGHVFKLGTTYSEPLGARFTDAAGQDRPMIMGCYGIGISRLMSAIVEQSCDDAGLNWPAAVAPYHIHLIPVGTQPVQMELAERLYKELSAAGADVLLDNRDERPGVKFKDADLIGIPVRLVIGKGAADGLIEYKERRVHGEALTLSAEAAVSRALALVKSVTRVPGCSGG